MLYPVDLHTHSSVSDGTDTPEALIEHAAELGLRAIALTDHDTTNGNDRAAAHAAACDVHFISATELSASASIARLHPEAPMAEGEKLGTLHLLGYGVAHQHPRLYELFQEQRAARAERNPMLLENLNRLGIDITHEDVLAEADRKKNNIATVGRPHIAQALVRKGVVDSVTHAFETLIGEGKPAYVRRDTTPAERSIAAIRDAGGVPVLAHPIQLNPDPVDPEPDVRRVLDRLIDLGLEGIETHHSDHPPAFCDMLTRIAKDMHLLTTGGSDYHGTNKAIALGSVGCQFETLDRLESAIDSRQAVAF